MNTDPIADLLTRVRNAFKARKEFTLVPHSNLKMKVLEILQAHDFVGELKLVQQGNKKDIKIFMPQRTTLTLKRISKPGRRVFQKSHEMRPAIQGYGIFVVSTPKGVMTGQEAKSANVGGEVLCEVY